MLVKKSKRVYNLSLKKILRSPMTLLSIVGEDTSRIIPVLYAYKDIAKHHILLCDDDPSNHQRAKTLQTGMKHFSAHHSLGWYTHIVTTNEDSASQIEIVAKKQFKYEGELWLNVTDGYPAMTILMSDFVRQEGGKVLSYDHFDNDLHIIEPDGSMETMQLSAKMGIEDYLTLLDYKIVEQKKKEELLPRKQSIMTLYKKESIYRKVRKALLDEHFGYKNNFDLSFSSDILDPLFNLGILDKQKKLIPSKQKDLQGDIFEEYLFWLCETLNPDDIALGVKIDFDDISKEPEAHKRVINEFDILIMHNNRIYTVECKLSQHLEGLEFVYKYDAIIDYFGKASKAIIANISSKSKENYIDTKSSDNFRHSTLRRARMSGIAVYHESQVNVIKFQNLIRNFFHIN